jgi:hypothetical protein
VYSTEQQQQQQQCCWWWSCHFPDKHALDVWPCSCEGPNDHNRNRESFPCHLYLQAMKMVASLDDCLKIRNSWRVLVGSVVRWNKSEFSILYFSIVFENRSVYLIFCSLKFLSRRRHIQIRDVVCLGVVFHVVVVILWDSFSHGKYCRTNHGSKNYYQENTEVWCVENMGIFFLKKSLLFPKKVSVYR